jgi:hypothetical protein
MTNRFSDPYRVTSDGILRNPYRSSNGQVELDLRTELHEFLHGSIGEIPKRILGLLRKMRTDSDGNLIRCPCRSDISDEPDRDSYCRFCSGHGYFWDEYKIWYYRNDEAFKLVDGKVQEFDSDIFYCEYSNNISPHDYLIELAVDNDGALITPIRRQRMYDIISAIPFKADRGRIEFWHLRARYQRDWSVYYGVKNRQY